MLPLIPALILLLLQGPSNVEKLVHEGRLPAALDAVHRSLEGTNRSSPEHKVLAQLIAASGDATLSRALAQILTLVSDEPKTQAEPRTVEEPTASVRAPEHSTPLPQEGLLRSQRTRDGPAREFES